MKYVRYHLDELSRGVRCIETDRTVVAGHWQGGREGGLVFSTHGALVREDEKIAEGRCSDGHRTTSVYLMPQNCALEHGNLYVVYILPPFF